MSSDKRIGEDEGLILGNPGDTIGLNMAEKVVGSSSEAGGCAVSALIFLLIVAGIILGVNFGIGMYGRNCGDEPIFKCLDEMFSDEKPAEQKGTVTAKGVYTHEQGSANMTLKIPLEGGAVTGTVTGDCGGKVTGSYNGKDKVGISGKFAGVCTVFLVNVPASATWGGIVNEESKTVPISFTGSGGGFSHSDSMSLSY